MDMDMDGKIHIHGKPEVTSLRFTFQSTGCAKNSPVEIYTDFRPYV